METSGDYCFQFEVKKADRKTEKIILTNKNRFEKIRSPAPPELGNGDFIISQNNEGFGYGELYTDGPKENIDIRISLNRDCFVITFLLSAHPLQVGLEGSETFFPADPSSTYLLFTSIPGIIRTEPGVPFHIFTAFIPCSRFYSVLSENGCVPPKDLEKALLSTPGKPYLHRGMLTPDLQIVIDKIRNCGMHGILRSLYLEGKLMELTALRLHEVCFKPEDHKLKEKLSLSGKDKKKILEAAEILACCIDSPPTITQLARKVGINTTKLKYGFRSEFDNTVFGYIHHLRMMRALHLLRNTEKNISEVAYSVGYSNLSAFSAAFKRDFGKNPSESRKEIF